MKYQRKTKDVNLLNLIDVITPLDKVDKIDNNLTENKFSVKNNNKLIKDEVTEMNLEKSLEPKAIDHNAKVHKDVKHNIEKELLIDNLLELWKQEYLKSRNIDYVVLNGKDHKGIKLLLELFKTQHPNLDSPAMLEYFKNFFKKVLAIDDMIVYTNINPMYIHSQLNKINLLLQKGKSKNSNSSISQPTSKIKYDIPFK